MLIPILKGAGGVLCIFTALFNLFVIIDLTHDLLKQLITHRKGKYGSCHLDVFDYINTYWICISLAALCSFAAYRIFS